MWWWGREDILQTMTENQRQSRRYSGLKLRLQERRSNEGRCTVSWISLFPPKCVLCGRLLDREETDLCGACRREGPVFSRRRNVHSLCDRLDGCLPL